MIALLLALTVTTLTSRTVVDTTHSEMATDTLVAFMNAHADQLVGMKPLGLIVQGKDTSVIVKGLPKDSVIYTKDGWKRPTEEVVDTVKITSRMIYIGDTLWWPTKYMTPCSLDTISIHLDAIDSSDITDTVVGP